MKNSRMQEINKKMYQTYVEHRKNHTNKEIDFAVAKENKVVKK